MMDERSIRIVEATLAWCNDRRAERGKKPLTELPKGVRRDPGSCPCGAATGLFVGYEEYGNPTQGKLPRDVREFVYLFDDGHLPEYDLYAESN